MGWTKNDGWILLKFPENSLKLVSFKAKVLQQDSANCWPNMFYDVGIICILSVVEMQLFSSIQ